MIEKFKFFNEFGVVNNFCEFYSSYKVLEIAKIALKKYSSIEIFSVGKKKVEHEIEFIIIVINADSAKFAVVAEIEF